MSRRHRGRAGTILAGVLLLGGAAGLTLNALDGNLQFYLTPSQALAGEAPAQHTARLGGLVRAGSIEHAADARVTFEVTDGTASVPVRYEGTLPDLFREGQGVVVIGRMTDDGAFAAQEVLARHDERYMPPEAAHALAQAANARPGEIR